MSKKRTSFTSEFKLEAVSLVTDKGYSVSEACQALGVGAAALRRWVNQLSQEREGITPVGSKALTPDQRQIQELQMRIQRLEMEKDILKKATALLVTDEFKYKR
jgi:transposase